MSRLVSRFEQSGASTVVGVCLLVLVVVVAGALTFTYVIPMFDSPDPAQEGITLTQTTDREITAEYIASGSSDTRYVESPLGTHYTLTNVSESTPILAVTNRDDVSVIGETDGSSHVLTTHEVTRGVTADIEVDTDDTHNPDTIQDAVNQSTDGDVIAIARDTYTENVNVTKNVTLIAEHGTVIEDQNPNEDVVHFDDGAAGASLTNVIIDGDPIPNDGHYARHGVYVGDTNIEVIGNQIKNASSPDTTSAGIYVDSAAATVQHNNVTNNARSLAFSSASQSTATCSNNFDSTIGGQLSDAATTEFVKQNQWSDGVPTDLALAVLGQQSKTPSTGDTVYNTIDTDTLTQSGVTINAEFTGRRLTPSESSDCQQLLAFTNEDGSSTDLLDVNITMNINESEVVVNIVSPTEFRVAESGFDERLGTFACTGCDDNSYDEGDTIVIPTQPLQESNNDPLVVADTSDGADNTTNSDSSTYTTYTVTDGGTDDTTTTISTTVDSFSGDIETTQNDTAIPISTGNLSVDLGTTFTANVGDEITLQPIITGANGTVTYDWTLGDGTTAHTQTVTHVYSTPGDYQICATVEDSDQQQSSDCTTASISPRPDPVTTVGEDTSLQAAITNANESDVLTLPAGDYGDIDVSTEGLTIIGDGDVSVGTAKASASGVTLKNIDVRDELIVTDSGFRYYSGSIENTDGWGASIQANNTVLSNADITAQNGIEVATGLTDVHLTESVVDASGPYGVDVSYHGKNIRLAHTTVTSSEYGIERGHATDLTTTDTSLTAPTPTNYIQNQPPTASANTDTSEVLAGRDVTFDVSGSDDPEGELTEFAWDFDGDGETEATGQSVTTSYSLTGQKTVTLTVTDAHGETATDTVTLDVRTNLLPTATISTNTTTTNVSSPITFDATESSDPEDGTLTYRWDFTNDGTVDASGSQIEHAFTSTGEKTVALTVEDPYGGTDTTTTIVDITSPPTAAFTANTTAIYTGESVAFDASDSTDAEDDTSDLTYLWDLDGDTEAEATGQNVTHSFTETRVVTLEVRDSDGLYDTAQETIAVDEQLGLVSGKPAESCAAVLDAHDDPADGKYWLDPSGNTQGEYKAYCSFSHSQSGDGPVSSAYTFFYVENGQATSYQTDANSCKARGLQLFAPRGPAEYDIGRDYVDHVYGKDPSTWEDDSGGLGPLGIYYTDTYNGHRSHYSRGWRWEDRDLHSSHYGSNSLGEVGWQSTAGDQWWAAHNVENREPNGDYAPYAWLYIRWSDNGNVNDYNDSNNVPSYDSYLCAG